MIKYPSIEQFRNVVKKVRESHDYQGKDENGSPIYRHISDYPTLKFIGTVKLHGTNSAIVRYADGRIEYQSRERVLRLEEDNAGFMADMITKPIDSLFEGFEPKEYIAIYGEWCGGNIQKGVAINGLEKMFVIFGVKVDGEWVDFPATLEDIEHRIYNIKQFKTFEIDIDFNQPELSQNKLIDMTIEVEENCPVGVVFGKFGIGEGIVFTCATDLSLKFKSKGEKHSASKVKVLNQVNTEAIGAVNEFVEMAVSENRLNQGIAYLKENNIEVDIKSTGSFLSWIVGDVLKEESDTIANNALDESKVKKAIAMKARQWFMNQVY